MTGLERRPIRSFPLSAGLLLGLGLGGFFDGIVLHQLLQWHHMLSSWYPITTIENLELNTFWDGVFHSGTYVFVLAGLFILRRCGRLSHFRWSTGDLVATMLIGFGAFNLIEGVIDHHVLGLHHVNEMVPRGQWLSWDLGFLAWGAAMAGVGLLIMRRLHG
ncbi:DUF2243 domain-containing protein [Rhizobium sp. 1AS11]|uniref:DUF2243 domain-containing protein n=1 Tax=Rhizobium acaciae TaxID=2989736 RepID=UPI0022224BCF|nr:DUF2243 domain-containing protein [Rhizobium acaciae]MCW1411851.1 DUF2243 domain-containing protein [Rhizobium acaciae]MCW1744001.1 DUF2243 domain-containing protein [Rhizobium acaciae]